MHTRPSLLFERWPRLAARHPWRVLAGTLLVVIGLGVASFAFGGRYSDAFSIPNNDAQRAQDLLKARFPSQAGDSAIVVVRAPAGMSDPQVHQRVDALVADLQALPEVTDVASPYAQQSTISKDGTIARITVQYDAKTRDLQHSSVQALADLRQRESTDGFQVEVGGAVIRAVEQGGLGNAELFGVAAAVVILLVAFGSVVAMGLPIAAALLALASGLLLIGIFARFVTMPSFTPEFGAMIGLGVGIDYALLTVTRFREGLGDGMSVDDAIARSAATAGRSVLFAGSTVVIAMLGLWAVGIPFVAYVGTAGAVVVAMSVIVALVVQPALLKVVGRHIDRWRVPFVQAPHASADSGVGYQLSRVIQRAPLPALAATLAVVLVMAIPVLRIHLGSSDSGNNPASYTSRRAYDLLSEGFGPGFNGPIIVAVRIDDAAAVPAVQALPAKLEQVAGVASVTPARLNAEGTAAVITVTPATSPQSRDTTELVHRLRGDLPRELGGADATALVGGSTAVFIDVGDRITSRLPLFFAAVIGLSFLLLMMVFRSVLVPVKAALMNLLAIAASYGLLVAIFQWGWGGSIIGVRPGPIESFLPMFLFAVLFGLSMDYEVFLVSRIREEYLLSGDSREAVARGLSLTTRLITAAAAIMVAVFVSFAFGDQRVIKEFGIGLGAAVLIDATLVRLVLVPAFMELAGDWNWWFPSWLDRIVPRISIEAPHLLPPAREPVPVRIDRG